MSESEVEGLLRRVASRLIVENCPEMNSLSPDRRLARLAELLRESGLLRKIQQREDGVVVEGSSCPLSQVVVAHPEICRIAAEVLGEMLGYPVSECCARSESSRCRFAITIQPTAPREKTATS
jgi:predicted ArsR family transcriptional regulator